MSVTATWDDTRQQAIVLTFTAPWTWAEFEVARDTIGAMIGGIRHEIDLIIDVRDGGKLPEDAIRWLRRSYASEELLIRRHILVGAPDFVRELFDVADRYYTALGGFLEFAFVASIEEARTLPLHGSEEA